MASGKKICCYHECIQEPCCTLFKFPTEKERFYAWVQRAGLQLNGVVNTSELRYICEKHFIPNYISTQSRRKMLVHTAVPKKYREDLVLDEGEPTDFTIVVDAEKQPRKNRFASRDNGDNDNHPANRSRLKRKWDEIAEDIESIEYFNESATNEQVVENLNLYEETVIPAPPREAKKYIVMKSKNAKLTHLKLSSPKKIINCVEPTRAAETEETFFLTEEGNIASSSRFSDEKSKGIIANNDPVAPLSKPVSLENCTEFIFNGELYVQMPKRVFDAEKERVKAEAENYRKTLLELGTKIDEILQR